MIRKVLITGGEGQLGKTLRSTLADKFNVLSTARNPSKVAINCRNVVKMDVVDKDNVLKVVEYFKPDIIINCAAYSDVDSSERNKNISHLVLDPI